jgi:hypothetical protein
MIGLTGTVFATVLAPGVCKLVQCSWLWWWGLTLKKWLRQGIYSSLAPRLTQKAYESTFALQLRVRLRLR